jgi:hypothetical protein
MKIRCGLRFCRMLDAVGLYFVQKTNLSRITCQKSEDLNYNLTEALNRATPGVSAASDKYLARSKSVGFWVQNCLCVCACASIPTLKLFRNLKGFTRIGTEIIPNGANPRAVRFHLYSRAKCGRGGIDTSATWLEVLGWRTIYDNWPSQMKHS